MVATYTTQTITNLSQSVILNGLVSALEAAGLSLVQTYTASNNYMNAVLKYQFSSATKDTAYLFIQINSTATYIAWTMYDSWSTTSESGTNPSPTMSTSFSSFLQPLTFFIINDTEFRGVFLQQYGWNSNNTCIGIARPSVQPPWWSTNNYSNTYLYCFVTAGTAYYSLANGFGYCNYSGSPTPPWGIASATNTLCSLLIYNSSGVCPYQFVNFNTGIPDTLGGLPLAPPSGGSVPFGIVGSFADFLVIPGDNLVMGSTVNYTVGSTTYGFLVISVPSADNTIPFGIGIRVS